SGQVQISQQRSLADGTGLGGVHSRDLPRPRAFLMSSPVSSCCLLILLDQSLKGSVFGGVVGDAVLPAVPDHIQPGAGEDPGGVWMVFAASDCLVIQPGRPWVGPTGVGGEVADRIAQLLVDRPAKADALVLAGLAGRGR